MSSKCDHCDREATVHEMTVRNGVKIERHLCESCAEKHGISVQPASASINDLVKSYMLSTGMVPVQPRGTVCPSCKLTFAEFKQQQLLGCPTCYEAFAPQLMPLLQRAQDGGVEHVGKRPGTPAKKHGSVLADDRAARMMNLRKELDAAVKSERYERAAKIRDELRRLEEGAR